MFDKLEPMSVLYVLFQIRDNFHFHIKDSATLYASCVIMFVSLMVETIGSAWHFHFSDLADIRQQVQIPIYRPSADIGVFLDDRIVDLVSGGMTPQLSYRFKN